MKDFKLTLSAFVGFSLIMMSPLIMSGCDQQLLPVREPDDVLKWTDMRLVDKQIIEDGGIGYHLSYHMIFKLENKVFEYDALSVEEYTSHNVGDIVSVGISSNGNIDSIHHGNDYGQFYRRE